MSAPDFSALETDAGRLIDLGVLASVVMHRAVNHLGSATFAVEYLEKVAHFELPKIEPDISRALESTLTAASLLRQFSAYALGSIPGEIETVELTELTREVQPRIAAIAGCSVGWSVWLESPVRLRGNPAQLVRMLEHLLAEAAAMAAPAGGLVSLRSESMETGDLLEISVGAGPWRIEDESAALADPACRRLVIARAIWRRHAGRIVLASGPVGPAIQLICAHRSEPNREFA